MCYNTIMNYIYLIIAGVLGYFLGNKMASKKSSFAEATQDELKEAQKESKEVLTERTEDRKKKILEFMQREAKHKEELKTCKIDGDFSQVTCNDVEKLLDVSEATAHKYLNELEKEGKVEQVGSVGRGVYYILAK